MTTLPKIIVIVGPTASGKSSLALKVAQQFNGEIINADSRQVYQEMDIGTAKPTLEERKRVPHHLIDVLTPNDQWDVNQFVKMADQAILEISKKNKLPIIVGGTGLYVRGLLFGIFDVPKIDPKIRRVLEKRLKIEGNESLYSELKSIDPEAALRIELNDWIRIVRALEVFQATGKTITEYQKEHKFKRAKYDYLKFMFEVERPELYERINQRVDQMMDEGLKTEALKLLEKYPHSTVLKKAIGYAEWNLKNDMNEDDGGVIDSIKKNTRRFAKRQLTWYRKESDIKLIRSEEETLKSIQNFLNES